MNDCAGGAPCSKCVPSCGVHAACLCVWSKLCLALTSHMVLHTVLLDYSATCFILHNKLCLHHSPQFYTPSPAILLPLWSPRERSTIRASFSPNTDRFEQRSLPVHRIQIVHQLYLIINSRIGVIFDSRHNYK